MARLATSQHGLVTSRQLAAIGVTYRSIGYQIAAGRLHPVHRGVYLVGHRAAPHNSRFRAAVLAVGADALLSHRCAGALWGLIDSPRGPVDVTVVGRRPRKRDGIHLHRVGHLDRQDVDERDGIAVTAPARTVLDLATTASSATIERAAAQARILGLITTQSLLAAMQLAPQHRAIPKLRELLARANEPAFTRSVAERKMLDLLRSARIGPTATNVLVNGHEADFFWREERLIVEVDGYRYHGSREAFERDRKRDGAYVAAGYRVLRVTWRQLVEEPAAVVATVAAAVAQRTA
ncbi:MAG: DUF559 domain-containing protein [Solirubrobacterales bacterium]|nr:DUF559 domain-containing protein [Solirubrobacterales bacterium]